MNKKKTPASPSLPSFQESPRTTSVNDDIPEWFRKILDVLKSRRPETVARDVSFRFGRFEGTVWPRILVKEVRNTQKGMVVVLEDDPLEYRQGESILGARLVSISPDEVLLDLGGEKRKFAVRHTFPSITVRTIRQVEGEWTTFLEGEKRAFYVGDTFKNARITAIDKNSVTFQLGSDLRRFLPKLVKPTFPEIRFNGVINMPGGRVVLVKDRVEPARIGDTVQGVRILDITPTHVLLELGDERRQVPIQ